MRSIVSHFEECVVSQAPVITIDGPSGTGKGTLAARLAAHLSFHLLDSGAFYRALAWVALQRGVAADDLDGLIQMMADTVFEPRKSSVTEAPQIWYQGANIGAFLRSEAVGVMASRLAVLPEVRAYLLRYQRLMQQPPGLVADGRDMGSVVFPNAMVKIFLDASDVVRAERRYHQLKALGIDASLHQIHDDLVKRDQRDTERRHSPMKPTDDMILIDSSATTADAVFELVLAKLPRALVDSY